MRNRTTFTDTLMSWSFGAAPRRAESLSAQVAEVVEFGVQVAEVADHLKTTIIDGFVSSSTITAVVYQRE